MEFVFAWHVHANTLRDPLSHSWRNTSGVGRLLVQVVDDNGPKIPSETSWLANVSYSRSDDADHDSRASPRTIGSSSGDSNVGIGDDARPLVFEMVVLGWLRFLKFSLPMHTALERSASNWTGSTLFYSFRHKGNIIIKVSGCLLGKCLQWKFKIG